VPDILFLSTSQLDRIQETYIEGPPDLIVEIVSSDSLVRDWREKYLEYQEAGVKEYWVIDPQVQKVEAYSLEERSYRLIPAEEGKVKSKVLSGFWLRPEWLWQDPLPNVLEIAREIGVI